MGRNGESRGKRRQEGGRKATSLNCSVKIWPGSKGSGMRGRRGRRLGESCFLAELKDDIGGHRNITE